MDLQLEARYLTIDWLGPKVARTLKASEYPIRIEPGSDAVPELEIQIFPDDFSWLGLRLVSHSEKPIPKWTTADGHSHQFIPVQDDHGTTWWVPALEWVAQGKRHLNAFSRSLGDFEISVGEERLRLRTITNDCSRVVLEDYMQSFKDDLIWLIFGFEGAGTVTGGSRKGSELVAAIKAFLETLSRVSGRLATEIREGTGEMPRHKLRPNIETFRCHARNPGARHLPSRLSVETADLLENRYLRHMAEQCARLVRQMHGVTIRQATASLGHASREMARAEEYERIEYHEVDPEIFDAQLAALENQLDDIQSAFSGGERFGGRVYEFPIMLTKRYANCTDKFFYRRLDDGPNEPGISFNVVRFPEDLAKSLFGVMDFSKNYTFKSTKEGVESSTEQTSTGKKYRLLDFKFPPRVNPQTEALENKRKKRVRLEQNGWRNPLGSKEKEEYQRAAYSVRKRAEAFHGMAERAEASSGGLAEAAGLLRMHVAAFEQRGIGHSSSFPSGMRFNMNPDYAACLKAFRRVQILMSGTGVKEGSLDRIEKIGTLHASAVYERWCLIKILTILISEYGFEPPADWQEKLIDKVTGLPEPLSLKLFRADIGLAARLEYQFQLGNGRRPDFRLRFAYRPEKEASTRGMSAFGGDIQYATGLIMDAKFRTRWRPSELQEVLDGLVEQKRYDLEGDRVFVLHPVSKSVAKPTSPLEWGRDCDYGQVAGTNHRCGSVWLSPAIGGGDEQRHLRRLIDLQLQDTFGHPPEVKTAEGGYGSGGYDCGPSTENIAPVWSEQSFCLSCGDRHSIEHVEFRKTKVGYQYWIIKCQRCGMASTRTHCYGCKTELFKNYMMLTYHNTIADQPTHVICPACGSYFDEDWRGLR